METLVLKIVDSIFYVFYTYHNEYTKDTMEFMIDRIRRVGWVPRHMWFKFRLNRNEL